MVYEAMLLFGIGFSAIFVFQLSTQSVDPARLNIWRQLYLFMVVGLYFTYFWRRNGQTLAMQTWHIKLVSADQQPLSFRQAWLRYCASWMWFLPALLGAYVLALHQWITLLALLATNMLLWALASRLDVDGQFLHDRLAGTLIITVPKKPRIADTE